MPGCRRAVGGFGVRGSDADVLSAVPGAACCSPGAAAFPSRRAPPVSRARAAGSLRERSRAEPRPRTVLRIDAGGPRDGRGSGAPHACSGLHRRLAELGKELYLWNADWYLTTMHYKMMMRVRHC